MPPCAPLLSRRHLLGAGLLGAAGGCATFAGDGAGARDWSPAVGSFEHGDSARSGLFAAAKPFSLPAGAVARVEIAAAMPGLWGVAIDGSGTIFALHGVIGGAASPGGPTVSALSPDGLREVWRRALPPPPTGIDWNYPGAIGAHANGHIYAAYSNRLAMLDPLSGEVIAAADLPTPNGPAHTTYNGFITLSDGVILAKSHHRKADCSAPGYRAFIECGVAGLPASALVLLEPRTLRVLWSGTAPELIGGRVSATRFGGREYIYLAGDTFVHRMIRQDGRLVADPMWGPVRYRDGAETPGTAAIGFGDHVAIQNNAIPTRAPLRVTIIHQGDSRDVRTALPFGEAGPSFMPSKLSADIGLGLLFSGDSFGGVAALELEPNGAAATRWRAPYRTGSFLTLLGPREARALVLSDIGAARRDAYGAPLHPSETVRWLDAATGAPRAEVHELPRNFGLTLTPSADGAIHYATREQGLYRLRVGPQA